MSHSIARLFVDRIEICDRFEAMLRGDSSKQIMLIQADGGMGKSWLISKFKHDCSRQSPRVPYTSIDFKDGQIHDFLSIVRTVRDDLGAAHFSEMTQVINEVTRFNIRLDASPSAGHAQSVTIGDVTASEVNIAGGHIIKDNFFNLQVPNESLRADVEARVTKVFLRNLRTLLVNQTAVLFFDTYEKAAETTQRWLISRLLHEIRERNLGNLLVMIAGRQVPSLDVTWKEFTTRPKLTALNSEDVRIYLQDKLGLSPGIADAATLFRASQGNPQLLGLLSDNVLSSLSDEDDW